jgi:hypothetical protein
MYLKGILKDLPNQILSLEFPITTTILKMEGVNDEYYILLGRPCLWQPKIRHD